MGAREINIVSFKLKSIDGLIFARKWEGGIF